MTAFPNLHALAYGEGGQRLSAELRVEAADALERLDRTCETCSHSRPTVAPGETYCLRYLSFERVTHSCGHWTDQTPVYAHDKEKS